MSKITLTNISSFQNDSSAVAATTANNASITTAFDNTLSRDGTSPNQMSASIDMNGQRILNPGMLDMAGNSVTGLPAASNPTDAVRYQDLIAVNPNGGGNVLGPTTNANNTIATWNGVNSHTIKDSGININAVGINDSVKAFGAIGDGTTDDTTAVQAALNSAGASSVYFPTGTFLCRALTVPTNIKLIYGPGTLKAGGAIAAFGTLLLVANGTNLTIKDITISVDKTTYSTINSIALTTCTSCKIVNVNFTNAGRFGVYIGGCTTCSIEECTIQNFAQSAIEFSIAEGALTRNRIVGNRLIANSAQTGSTVDAGVVATDTEILDNIIEGNTSGFAITAQGWVRGIISRNIIRNNASEAIVVGGDKTEISYNHCSWDAGVSIDYGMSFVAVGDGLIIRGNLIYRSGKTAIAIGSTASGFLVENNRIIDCNNLNDATNGNGIELLDTSNSHVIRNNYIRNQTADGHMLYGIREFGSTSSNRFEGNFIYAMVTSDYLIVAGNSKIVERYDISGGNPTGDITFLGVTGSTFNKITLTTPASAATFTLANNKTFTVSNTGTISGGDSWLLSIAAGKTATFNNTTTFTGGDASIWSLAASKTFTVSNTLTFTGTDASSVAFGTGGTVAYRADNLSVFSATTSAQLAGVISDETGSGLLVFATTPTFTTNITSPKVIGGTGVGSSLSLQSTSGVGSTSFVNVLVGNNGGTLSTKFFNSGGVCIGTTSTDPGVGGVTSNGPAIFGGYVSLAGRTLVATSITAGSQPAFAFYHNAAGAGNKVMTFIYDGQVVLTNPGMLFQGLDDTGGFVNNSMIFWRDGGITTGASAALTYPAGGAGAIFVQNTTDSSSSVTGSLVTTGGVGIAKAIFAAGSSTIESGTAIPAGGTAGKGYKLSSTSNFGTFFGSGAPTLSSAQGSLYLRSDGSTGTRAYVNTSGSTTWHSLATLNDAGIITTAPISINFNAAGDNNITVPLPTGCTRIGIVQAVITGASGNISAATFGLFTATGGGGTAIIAAGTAVTVTTAADNTNNNMQNTNQTNINTETFLPVANTIYFRIGTTTAGTANVQIRYVPYP